MSVHMRRLRYGDEAGTQRMDAELTAWKETATAVAAGLGRTEPEWLEKPRAVDRP